MPSTSAKQHRFMAAVANNPAFAKKAGVPQSVGQDFDQADRGRKFSKGGSMATKGVNPFAKGKDEDKKLPPWLQKGPKKMATGGAVTPPTPKPKPPMTTQEKEMVQEVKDNADRKKATKAYDEAMPDPYGRGKKGYAQGGSVSSRADGIAQRGRTKGKMV